MSDAKESTATVAGCKIDVMRGGKGDPLLFLHGAGGVGIWLPFFEKLSEHFDVIVPEHPGFGRSDTPEWLDHVSDLANFYLEFIDKLGLKGIHLVGNSLGGWIAADLAVRNTTPLRTLTLLAPAGIHVPGVPPGDIFLWTPEAAHPQPVSRSEDRRHDAGAAGDDGGATAADQERARARQAHLAAAPATTPTCASGCTASTVRR